MSLLEPTANMCSLEASIPRSGEDEPLFPLAWHARAFSLIVSLVETGEIEWGIFQKRLVDHLQHHEPVQPASAEDINRAYFDAWLEAAEELLIEAGYFAHHDIDHQIEHIKASVAEIKSAQLGGRSFA